MKRFTAFAFSALLALAFTGPAAQAQQVTVNINPPSWGPAAPAGTQYYYIPEVGGYYDLRDQYYVVERKGKWQRLKSISGYTPSSFHPVVIDYRGAQPWVQITRHRQLYPVALPPGQVKRLQSGKGLPPGQAKKLYGGHGHGHGNGKGKH
ncbi:hypothetical protein MUN82_17050 [Hymenobacter aerilatus]|uniref:Uncharacterized protein n=1 Tax=Hymenobacter aerilatus TaxID=2932251 RepID=A0A8T9SUK6_9BACT|nr:hypothetical protein [Hymenobacter aerilatus]UOR04644.1 hypothetical protein MUN82_17050 [Hymenobacter aerilatus]